MCAQFWHIKHGCQVETSWILSLSGAERKQPWSLTARVLSLSNWFWKGFISFPHQSEEEEAMNPLLQWKKRKIIRVKTLLSQIDLSSRGLSGPDVSELDWGCDAVRNTSRQSGRFWTNLQVIHNFFRSTKATLSCPLNNHNSSSQPHFENRTMASFDSNFKTRTQCKKDCFLSFSAPLCCVTHCTCVFFSFPEMSPLY